MSPIADRIAPPASAAASAPALALSRRPPEDARPPDSSPDAEGGPRPGPPRARDSNGAPDPSGRSGGLVDVFA